MDDNNIIDPTPAVGGTEASEEEELNAEVEVEDEADKAEAETVEPAQPEADDSEAVA